MTSRRIPESAENKEQGERPAPDGSPGRSGLSATLEGKLGYHFRQPRLLHLALTHRSHAYESRNPLVVAENSKDQKNEPGTDNEQLEFVGDAILGLVVTEALYRHFPHCSEGELTRLRASLVSRERMAQMGTELGLGEHLKLGRSAEANGGRRKPALLANAAEAVLAAVYLDSGDGAAGGLAAVRPIVDRLLVEPDLPHLKAALAGDAGRGAMRDGKTLLQERVQAENSGKLRYVDVGESGPAHQRRFAVEVRLEADGASLALATAEGSSKKQAQQRAASLALNEWDSTRRNGEGKPGATKPETSGPVAASKNQPGSAPAGASAESERYQEGAS
jgi:ribonuclease-3